MPKISARQKKIISLRESIQRNRRESAKKIINATSDEELDSIIDDVVYKMIVDKSSAGLSQILSNRYLTPKRKCKKRRIPVRFESTTYFTNEKKFCQTVRMTKETFDSLVNELKDHKVYLCRGAKPQSDLRVQIMLVLDRIGANSDTNSIDRLSKDYGISEGSVVKFTQRFFEAVVSLKDKYIYWPTDEEKNEIKKDNAKERGFKNCIGFINGLTIDLVWKPATSANEFLRRKDKYALQTMGICDHNMKIRFLTTQFYGSRSDSEIYSSTDICKHPAKYFSGNEYLLADSKYALTEHIITPFSNVDDMDSDMHRFNHHHESTRVTIDETFDNLKMRFRSLHELPVQLKNQTKDMTFAQQWILVCVILHNKLRTLGGVDIDLKEYDSEQVTEEETEDDDSVSIIHQPEINRIDIAQLKRDFVMSEVL